MKIFYLKILLQIKYAQFKDFIQTSIAALQLKVYIIRANLLHASDGKKYYVLRTDTNRYVIMNSNDIRDYLLQFPKRERNFNYYTLLKNACYQTKTI